MADAGRILIMPKGTYDATVSYGRLDLVQHNNAIWLAKKESIGIEPNEENSEHWFFMMKTDANSLGGKTAEEWQTEIDSVLIEATQVFNDIINGTTTVGNADKVNEITFYKGYTEIDSSFSNQTSIVDLVAGMARDSRLVVTVFNGSTEVYPSELGILEIYKHGVSGNYSTVKFTERNSGRLWSGVVQSENFTGWQSGLPTTGGKLENETSTLLTLNNTNAENNDIWVDFQKSGERKALFGFAGDTLAIYKPGSFSYNILHTGNKPSGTYVGNGDKTKRVIQTGGVGRVCVVYRPSEVHIVTGNGVLKTTSSSTSVGSSAKFWDGELQLEHATDLNSDGVTYSYQVL